MVELSEIVAGLPATDLVYWEDSYRREFDASALRIVLEGKRNVYAVLDRTCFHPKSGGQPSDTGSLFGEGFEVEIKKAMQFGDMVIHWGKISRGDSMVRTVRGAIDWGPRHLYMKRHTAGHLLDHCLTSSNGSPVRTTDSWLGDPCYVGYAGEIPSQSALERAELMEREMIGRGAQVKIEIVTYDALLMMAPDAPNIYRLPQLPRYRIVTIEGCDPIPCGGCHLRDITEIGEFRILSAQLFESGYRVYYSV